MYYLCRMSCTIRYIACLVIIIICYSCNEESKKKAVSGKKKTPKSNATVNNDTLFVRTTMAVAYEPDNTTIEKRKKAIGEKNFRIGQDDYLFYMNYSQEFLNKVKIPVQEAGKRKYLKFIQADNSYTLIKTDTLSDLWGIFFFKPTRKPLLADITVIQHEYRKYFK